MSEIAKRNSSSPAGETLPNHASDNPLEKHLFSVVPGQYTGDLVDSLLCMVNGVEQTNGKETQLPASLVDINVLVSKSAATIRCTVNGYKFDRTGPLKQVLAEWQAFMDRLPTEDQAVAKCAMDIAKVVRQ